MKYINKATFNGFCEFFTKLIAIIVCQLETDKTAKNMVIAEIKSSP